MEANNKNAGKTPAKKTAKKTAAGKTSSAVNKVLSSVTKNSAAKKQVNNKVQKATSVLNQAGIKDSGKVVAAAAAASNKLDSRKKKKKLMPRLLAFAVIAVIMFATLPFSGFFDGLINRGGKGVGDFNVVRNNDLVVHFVDVGQGDCIMVELPDGKTMIIDAGSTPVSNSIKTKIVNYANEYIFKTRTAKLFDYAILTHSDADHCSAFDVIFGNFIVDIVYRPYSFFITPDNPTAERLAFAATELALKNSLGMGSNFTNHGTAAYYNFLKLAYEKANNVIFHKAGLFVEESGAKPYRIDFWGPMSTNYSGSQANKLNNLSAVITIEYKGKSIMLTGDAHSGSEAEMVAAGLPKVDALKLAHHGSDTSTTQAFLAAVDPTYIYICVGANNNHDHPKKSVMDRLTGYGINAGSIFRTDLHGDLLFATSGETIAVATSNGNTFFIYIKWWYVVTAAITLAFVIVVVPSIGSAFKKK